MRIGSATSLAFPAQLLGGRGSRSLGSVDFLRAAAGGESIVHSDSPGENRSLFSVAVGHGSSSTPLAIGIGVANASDGDAQNKIQALLSQLRRLAKDGPTADALPTAESPPAAAVATIQMISTTDVVSRTLIQGRNDSQITDATVAGLRDGQSWQLQGQVTRKAEAATLTLAGGDGANVAVSGIYRLTGTSGSITLELTAGESLANVAARINEETSTTGVTAAVSSNNLQLSSTGRGEDASVALRLVSTPATAVDGVNAAQVENFEFANFTAGASETLTGTVVSTAQAAELVYRGAASGVATGTATFRLTGTRGSTTLTITTGESLADVAQRVNDATASSGVVASLTGDDLRLTSDTTGAAAMVRVDEIEVDYDTSISAVNAGQISDFSIASLATGTQHVVSGQVLQSASQASLRLQGGPGGTVIDTATFEVRGALGAAPLSISEGESLAAVAQRVNDASGVTGVTANVDGDQLLFQSTDVGSSAEVSVQLIHVAHETTVTGVNSQQITAFAVDDFTEGDSITLNGSVTSAAGIAELEHQGAGSWVGATSTFTLTGSVGSAQFSTTFFQSLTTLRNQVNAKTAQTGVVAVVESGKIKFRSVGTGSNATVDIDVISGAFLLAGGDGNGFDSGANAVAVINGQTITATGGGGGNQFQFSDAVGTYSFTVASGFTGSLSAISIESQAGSFDITGGNGAGTANGQDAQAQINGVTLTGVGNRFVVGDAAGQFELEFASGFTGQFDDITVSSTPHMLQIDGGNEAGAAYGADGVAMVNGVERTSADNRFSFVGEHGSYDFEFAAGFTGDFDAITLQTVQITSDTDLGSASGASAEAVINGQQLVASGSQFQFAEDGRRAMLTFAADFTGEFDTITATQNLRVVQRPRTTTVVSRPDSEETDDSTLAEEQHALGQFGHLLDDLDTLVAAARKNATSGDPASEATHANRLATTQPAPRPTKAEIASQWLRAIARTDHFAGLFDAGPQASAELEQMRRVLDLLA